MESASPRPHTGALTLCEHMRDNYPIIEMPNPSALDYQWCTGILGATIGRFGTTATVNYPNVTFLGDVCVVANTFIGQHHTCLPCRGFLCA